MEKITEEKFNEILTKIENGDNIMADWAVRCIISGHLYSDRFSEISSYMKKSLCRKAFRSVARRSSEGTFEATGVSISGEFHLVCDGEIKMIDGTSPRDFSFTFTSHSRNPERKGVWSCHREGDNVVFSNGSTSIQQPITDTHGDTTALVCVIDDFQLYEE